MIGLWLQSLIVGAIGLFAAAYTLGRYAPGLRRRALGALAGYLDSPRHPQWLRRLAPRQTNAAAGKSCGDGCASCGSCGSADARANSEPNALAQSKPLSEHALIFHRHPR